MRLTARPLLKLQHCAPESLKDVDGRSLCALEGQLGILERSNADAGGGRGMDAGDVRLAEGAAGEKVQASFVSAKRLAVAAKEAPSAQQADAGEGFQPRRPIRNRLLCQTCTVICLTIA